MKNRVFWICSGIIILAVLSLNCMWLSWLVLLTALCYTLIKFTEYTYRWIKYHDLKTSRRERFLKMLAGSMALLLVIGCMLFFGIQCFIDKNSASVIGAFIDALDLFMLDVDAVLLNKRDNLSWEIKCLEGAVYVVTVLSFTCTLAIFISLVYERLWALYKLRKLRTTKNVKSHLYIFWGMNDSSKLLAQSIREKDKEESAVIFVEETQMDEKDNKVWNSIFSLFSHERKTFDYVKDLNSNITIIDSMLSDITIGDGTEDILGQLNMPTTKRVIERLPAHAQLHVFFLSDDEQKNIENLNALTQDQTIDSFSKKEKSKVKFYCHALYNSQTQLLEDKYLTKNIQVKIVDSSKLSVEILKRNVRNHPVSFVEINKDTNPGTVKSAFHSLIIGFGETGRAALRFLYEYSAFLDEKSDESHTQRSPFHCDIVDEKMDKIKPHFVAGIPGVKNTFESFPLDFLQCNYASQDFYNKIMTSDYLFKINYIVVSLGNDEEGMRVVCRILKQVIKFRGKDINKFRIYLRVFDQNKTSELQKIADFYNTTVDYTGKNLNNPLIVLFGKPKDIFDYNIIVNDSFEKEAEKYYTRYQEIYAEKEQLLTTGTWDNRRKLYLGKERMVISEIPSPDIWKAHMMNVDSGMYADRKETYKFVVNPSCESAQLIVGFEKCNGSFEYKKLQKLHRQVSQDMSNALHARTKMYIYNELKASSIFDKNVLMRNLAITEHLRWNAAHEMMGYVSGDKNSTSCDDLKKKHNCLVPWEELDEVSNRSGYSYYDFCPFAQRLKELYPELEYYLSHDIYVYVPYHPIYKRYDEVVVETTLQMWENGEFENKDIC